MRTVGHSSSNVPWPRFQHEFPRFLGQRPGHHVWTGCSISRIFIGDEDASTRGSDDVFDSAEKKECRFQGGGIAGYRESLRQSADHCTGRTLTVRIPASDLTLSPEPLSKTKKKGSPSGTVYQSNRHRNLQPCRCKWKVFPDEFSDRH